MTKRKLPKSKIRGQVKSAPAPFVTLPLKKSGRLPFRHTRKLVVLAAAIAIGFGAWRISTRQGPYDSTAAVLNENITNAEESSRELLPTLSGSLAEPVIAGRRPLAVVIENHPDSRPQSGVSKAEIVHEMVAEGGITRFLAIFQDNVPSIGPVRSARQYYAEIADGYGSLFAHVGGSPEVLGNMNAGKFKNLIDLNEFFHASRFERIASRRAPHNAYTSTNRLYEHLGERKTIDSVRKLQGLEFESDDGRNPQANPLTINFSKPEFKVVFRYDATANNYQRFIDGQPDIDAATKQQIAPTTVIIQETDITPIPGDPEGRMRVRTVGSGRAYVFARGHKIEAKWSRTHGDIFAYSNLTGQSIEIDPGQIWIAMVSLGEVVW